MAVQDYGTAATSTVAITTTAKPAAADAAEKQAAVEKALWWWNFTCMCAHLVQAIIALALGACGGAGAKPVDSHATSHSARGRLLGGDEGRRAPGAVGSHRFDAEIVRVRVGRRPRGVEQGHLAVDSRVTWRPSTLPRPTLSTRRRGQQQDCRVPAPAHDFLPHLGVRGEHWKRGMVGSAGAGRSGAIERSLVAPSRPGTRRNDLPRTELLTRGMLPFCSVTSGFAWMSAAAHGIVLLFFHSHYIPDLRRGINRFRWFEYAASSSLMIGLIAMVRSILFSGPVFRPCEDPVRP